MKKLTVALLALAAALAITPSAFADPINGSIIIAGNSETWSDISVSFPPSSPTAGAATGDFMTALPGAVTPGTDPVTIDVHTFGNTITFAIPDVLVWTVYDTTTNTATFTITGPLDVVTDTAGVLYITGTGNLTLTGYDTTPADFSFTATDPNYNHYGILGGDTYNFDVYTTSPIPEPGTLGLFGTGLIGLIGALRYKFLKSR
jgi:hypothetical protein